MTDSAKRLQLPVLVLLLLATFPIVVTAESWPYGALLLIGSMASWRWGALPHPPRTQEILLRVAAVGALIWALIDWRVRGTTFILCLAHFLIMIAACKTWERRTVRDLSLLFLMALMLLLISAIVSAELLFPISMIGFLVLGPHTALRLHLERERELAAAVDVEQTRIESPTDRVVRFGGLARLDARIALVCIVFGLAVFVLTPRLAGRSSAYWLAASHSFTGFDASNDLNRGGGIFEDDDLVMRVWAWQGDRPLLAEEYQPYLRAYSLRQYLSFHRGERTRFGWRPAEQTHVSSIRVNDRDEATNLIEGSLGTSPTDEVQLTVMLERRRSNYLFTVYPPLAIHSPQLKDLNKEVADQSVYTTIGRRRSPLRYTVWSVREKPASLLEALDRERNVVGKPKIPQQIPVSQRVLDQAQQLWAQAGRPDLEGAAGRIEVLRAIARYLQSDEFSYTLEAPARPSDVEPIEHFLFTSKAGHCEIYATTMAVLCQTLGIPARYVTGYLGSEFNPVAECFLVRQSDAHAWVEAFVPGNDWMTFDPSPLAAGEYDQVTLWDTVLDYWDYFRYKWISLIVSYDTFSRRELIAQFTNWMTGADVTRPAGLMPRIIGGFKDLLLGPPGLSWGQRLFYWAVLSLVLLLVAAVVRFIWRIAVLARSRMSRRAAPRPGHRFYHRLVRILARAGFTPDDGQTPREFASAVAARRSALRPAIQAVDYYYAVRFGRHTPPAADAERMDRLLVDLEATARRPG